jgi:hypothetical protein
MLIIALVNAPFGCVVGLSRGSRSSEYDGVTAAMMDQEYDTELKYGTHIATIGRICDALIRNITRNRGGLHIKNMRRNLCVAN